MKTIVHLLLTFSLVGCVAVTQPSIPPGYNGPTATIQSSAIFQSGSEAILFYLEEVEGRPINTALLRAEVMSNSTNSHLIADPENTLVAVGPTKLKLLATHVLATPPGFPLKTKTLTVKEIQMVAQQEQIYQTKGSLSEGKVKIWLENLGTGEVFE